ncbi:hypothetical protein [Pseudomonas aeruginosa]|uniref:hypothetical protein n=1 Tax=Pseudomonas aeruginosa TaxID=287 RepID=UPI00352614C2
MSKLFNSVAVISALPIEQRVTVGQLDNRGGKVIGDSSDVREHVCTQDKRR